MADLADVEQGLQAAIAEALYPHGADAPSSCGFAVKIYRGWPNPLGLNADLSSGIATVSLFSDPHEARETTRYPRAWREATRIAATLTAIVAGNTVEFGGTASAGEIVGILIDGAPFTYAVLAVDTPSSVATALAAAIPGGSASGAFLLIGGAASVAARVETPGSASIELRRQEQTITVSLWCNTPAARDTLAAAVDGTLAAIDWLPLVDGTSGLLRYLRTAETDTSEKANLYRRDLFYAVDYPTIRTIVTPPMVFGVLARGATATITTASDVLPRVGAIRFDAWYAPDDTIDTQCAAALGSAKWSDRWPPNASSANGSLSWPAATQATIDAEIEAALVAGLDFWAFDSYPAGDGLGVALALFLTSASRGKLRFCMLGQISNWADPTTAEGYATVLDRDVGLMAQPDYLSVVIGGVTRPVYFVLDATPAQLGLLPAGTAGAIATVRAKAAAVQLAEPYVVWLSAAPLGEYDNTSAARTAGADAAGAYTCPGGPIGAEPFSALATMAMTDWSDRRETGFPSVPTVMTGWDPRPLIETPQPFYPVPSSDNDANFYLEGEPTEIADQVSAMLDFLADNPGPCPSGVGLIYAWNELLEGGWIMPTAGADGPDDRRIDAIGAATSAWRRRRSIEGNIIA